MNDEFTPNVPADVLCEVMGFDLTPSGVEAAVIGCRRDP